jgi:hypothetical protein
MAWSEYLTGHIEVRGRAARVAGGDKRKWQRSASVGGR